MASPLSAGDCIAIAKLIKDIVQGFSRSRGAAAEFQSLTTDLDNLHETLQAIAAVAPNSDLNSRPLLQRIIHACQTMLKASEKTLKKYSPALAASRSQSILRTAFWKVLWIVSFRQEIGQLRGRVIYFVGLLNAQLIIQNSGESNKHFRAVSRQIRTIQQGGNALSHAVENTRQKAESSRRAISAIGDLLSGELVTGTKNVQDDITLLVQGQDHLLQTVRGLQLSPQMDTKHTWFQQPIKFEDGLGDIWPFPSEFDFSDLLALLHSRFQGRGPGYWKPGYVKVQRNEFELCNSTNNDLVDGQNFHLLQPGAAITMSFVIGRIILKNLSQGDLVRICPRVSCGSRSSREDSRGGYTCLTCHAWYDKAIGFTSRPFTARFLREGARYTSRKCYLLRDQKAGYIAHDGSLVELYHTKRKTLERRTFKNFRIIQENLPQTPHIKNVRRHNTRDQGHDIRRHEDVYHIKMIKESRCYRRKITSKALTIASVTSEVSKKSAFTNKTAP